MIDSGHLAEYILQKCGGMSHLKLQKLLYYVQAMHLAYFDQPLIEDDFEAWVHGPVSRKVFSSIKDHSVLYDEVQYTNDGIEPFPDTLLKQDLTTEQLELVDEVLSEFGKLSSLQLEGLTHSESPWMGARVGYAAADRCNVIIPKETMRNYYKQQVYGR